MTTSLSKMCLLLYHIRGGKINTGKKKHLHSFEPLTQASEKLVSFYWSKIFYLLNLMAFTDMMNYMRIDNVNILTKTAA
jgi:hypothetical protein